MAVKLHENGAFTWTEWAEMLSREIHSRDAPYYESWLSALEKIVEAKGLMSRPEREARINEWDRAAKTTPHGKPIELSR
jgi:nitrile hydratase accessory protein